LTSPHDATTLTKHLKQRITELERRLDDLQARMPAHSIPPAMIAELDELDEKLAAARKRLAALSTDSTP